MTLPCASILGTGWIAYMGYRALKRKQILGLEWMLLFWFLIGRASATATPHQVMRFHLLYFFPVSMMAAMAADRMWRTKAIGSRKKAIQTLVIAFVAYELVMTGVPWFKWVLNPRYDHVAERFKKFFPQRYEQRKKVAEFPVRTRHLVLWRVATITEPKPGTLRTKETKK